MEAAFGDVIALERAKLPTVIHAGGVLPVVLCWRAMKAVPADYHVFVHLLDADGNRVAHSDGVPATWTRPTSGWSPGEAIEDRHGLSLGADLPAAEYRLVVGLYVPGSRQRLQTEGGESFAVVGTVRLDH